MATIAIKTPGEISDTLRERTACNRGFLSRQWIACLVVLGLLGFVTYPILMVAAVLILLGDFVYFVIHRGRMLTQWDLGQPRLVSAQDFSAVSLAYEEAGIPEPTMTDFETAAGFSGRPDWQRDLRYRVVVREYQSGSVADVGCGDGRLCWKYMICPPELYTGVDVGRDLLRVLLDQTAHRATAIEATAEQTGLPSESIDFVACTEAFEHLPDPTAALREFTRIAKPGGRILIQSPSATRLRNVNPFHIVQILLGRLWPSVLQRTIVHENTFVRAFTYHWDFTRQDFERYIEGLPLVVEEARGAMYRFDPRRSFTHRVLYTIAKLPLVNLIWWDLTVVLRKGR